MIKQKTDITYLIRRIIYALVFIAIGLGAALFLEYRFKYSWVVIFAGITAFIVIGIAMNAVNYFTTKFYEENDALIIEYGLSKKKITIIYSSINRCVIKQSKIDKLFKTKQLSIFCPDYKGIISEQILGLKADYADVLSNYIMLRLNGSEGDFPII